MGKNKRSSKSKNRRSKSKCVDKKDLNADQGTSSLHKALRKKMKVQSVQHPKRITRSATRQQYSEGCVWDPPTTEDENEIREWPVEGMLEHPVWPDPRYEDPVPRDPELKVIMDHSLYAVLGDIVQHAQLLHTHSVSREEQQRVIKYFYDLLLNTALMYCIACCVSQDDLANYINSLTVETLSQWLEEMQ